MQSFDRAFILLFLITFILGVYIAYTRFETVSLLTQDLNIKRSLEQAKYQRAAFKLEISKYKKLNLLDQQALNLGLKYSY